MAITNATRVADFGSGIGAEGALIKVDNTNDRIGIGTNNPQTTLQVGTDVTVYGNTGIVSATTFYGDGSNLTNAGSTLSPGSGDQRVVVTSLTSGAMASVATDADLSWNSTTNTLSPGNLSIGGTVTSEDVTNVDSLGIVTARTGIKVLAGGINAAGVVTATSFSGDGSNLTGVELGTKNFVASGTIDNGKTVILKADGTVGIVTGTSVTTSSGTPVVFEDGGDTRSIGSAFDSTNGKVVISYRDYPNSQYGTAVVGTVSGTDITFGTPVVFESATTDFTSAAFVGSSKVVICYQDYGNSYYGTAIVGTVSGTSISFGSPVVFHTASTNYNIVSYIGNDKVVVAYNDWGDSGKGKSVVGTVSGTSISFGSATAFNSSGSTIYISSVYDSTNDKVVIAYTEGSSGKAIVGTVSGTSISFGSEVEFDSTSPDYDGITYDSANGKVVIVYVDTGNSDYGTAVVGTVSGTSISFGTPVVFESAATRYTAATYDSTMGKVVIAYRDIGNSDYGTAIVGTVSGTSISFDTPVVFESAQTYFPSVTYDSTNGKVVISYKDAGNSNKGTSVVFTVGGTTTNLTTENYIGISAEAIANAATGKISVLGGVNSGQSGLTTAKTYYVAPTGILTTTAGSPSVVAGTSISDTKVLVR